MWMLITDRSRYQHIIFITNKSLVGLGVFPHWLLNILPTTSLAPPSPQGLPLGPYLTATCRRCQHSAHSQTLMGDWRKWAPYASSLSHITKQVRYISFKRKGGGCRKAGSISTILFSSRRMEDMPSPSWRHSEQGCCASPCTSCCSNEPQHLQ